jgi:hypothetical protein
MVEWTRLNLSVKYQAVLSAQIAPEDSPAMPRE